MLTSKKGAANVTTIVMIAVTVVLAIALVVTAVVLSNANKDLKASTEEKIADLKAQIEAKDCITEAEVEAMLAALPAGVDKAFVTKEITAAINSYKMRDISSYVIQLMIDKSIAAIEHPAGITEAQVKEIVDTAVAGIKKGLTEAEVKALIEEALKAQDTPDTQDKEIEEKILDGEHITLTADDTITAAYGAQLAVFEGEEVVLDLGGYTLTIVEDFYGINVFGKLTIKNGTIITNKTSQLHAVQGGTMELDGVKVIQKAGGASSVTNYGTVVIDGCEFINENPLNNSLISNGTVREGKPIPGTMTIKNTTVSGTYADPGMAVIWNNSGTLTFGEDVVINAVIPESWIYKFGVVDTEIETATTTGTVTLNGNVVTY